MADDLEACRTDIDRIDDALVALLAERFAGVDRVIAHKLAAGLPAAIPERIEEVVARVRGRAVAQGLSPGVAENIWRRLITETIAYERQKRVV